MIHYSINPNADFDAWDAEQEAILAKLPQCEICGEPIQQDFAVYYNDQWICEACESEFWKDIRSDFLVKVDID